MSKYNELYQQIKSINPSKSGLCKLIFVPIDFIISMPDEFEIMTSTDSNDKYPIDYTEIIIQSGYSFNAIETSHQVMELTEVPKDTTAGRHYESQLKWVMSVDEWATRGSSNLLLNYHQFLVIAKDLNKNVRLMGNLDRGADFTYTQTNKAGKNDYECQFNWINKLSMHYVIPF